MKKGIIACLVLIVIASLSISCKNINNSITGDGNVVTKEISISDYSKVDAGGVVTVIYKQSETDMEKLTIEIDENLLEHLDVTVEDGTLKIRTDKKQQSINPSKFNIYTSSKEITDVNISGVSKFIAEGDIKADELEVTGSGVSNISLMTVRANKVQCEMSGTSKLKASDVIVDKKLNLLSSGTSKMEINRLEVSDLTISSSGVSKVEMQEVKADVVRFVTSGTSKITLDRIETTDLKASSSGVSKIEMSTGEVDKARFGTSGTSKIKATGVTIRETVSE